MHLRLPSKPHDTIYVYIRKNECSAFRQWLAAEHGADGTQRNLSIGKLTKRVKVTNEDQIDTSCRVLVLRDPAARLCSLFRNKLIQRSGAEDILANIQALTGLSVDKLTFRQFVEVYVEGTCIAANKVNWQKSILIALLNTVTFGPSSTTG